MLEFKKIDIADLNWARIEHWRNLIAAAFHNKNRFDKLQNTKKIEITYNSLETKYFCREKVKPLYLQAWLASCLDWKIKKIEKNKNTNIVYTNGNSDIKMSLIPSKDPGLVTGSIISLKLTTENDDVFFFSRDIDIPHRAKIEISSKTSCEIPYYSTFIASIASQSLTREIFYRNTSKHFISCVSILSNIKDQCIC